MIDMNKGRGVRVRGLVPHFGSFLMKYYLHKILQNTVIN